MYGDQRHISVLRAEFVEDDDEVFRRRYGKEQDLENELYQGDESEARFLQDSKHEDILNTKFIFSDEPNWSVKLGDLKSVPHFTERLTTAKPGGSNGTQGENQTDATLAADEGQSTVFTERTTDEATTDTTVNQATEETVTEAVRTTEKPAAVLFQDMEEDKPSKIDMNYKLKGV